MAFAAAALPAIEAISAGVGILGAIKGAQGANYQAQAEANSATYNSEVAANNAKISTQNAAFAAAEGNSKVEAQQQKTRAQVGAITANQGASGVDVNSGSAPDVRSSARETGELSAINIRADAARQAYGFQNEAAGYTATSGLDTAQAQNDITAGQLNSSTALTSGLSNVGSNFGKFVQGGGLGGSSGNSDITSSSGSTNGDFLTG